jgi:DNA-directed RNA polymerase specialized sigma24 family protein
MYRSLARRGELGDMPRTSRHVIELSQDERVELERRAATVTLPFRVVQRARIVLYAAEGMQDIDIAARLDCSPDSVARRRRRFCAERLDGLEDQARSGRPRRFSPARGRRSQGHRVRAAGPPRSAAVTLLAR